MARLSEEMVIARTRASDLSTIKKLNCWGGELQDISLLRRMSNVEVLSLSVNKISTLADIQYCKNLKELYVRKNNIRNLNEICYLKNLSHLKALWLGENPCSANDPTYRMTVIKNLPTLEKLDDVKIEPEEKQDAFKKGRDLIHPEDCEGSVDGSPSHSPVRSSKCSPVGGRSWEREDREDPNERRKSYGLDYEDVQNYGQDARIYPTGQSYESCCDDGININTICDASNECGGENFASLKKDNACTESATSMRTTNINQSTNTEEGQSESDPIKVGYCNYCNNEREGNAQKIGDSRRGSGSEGSGRMSPQKNSEEDRCYQQQQQYERIYRNQNEGDYQRIEAERYPKPPPYPSRRPVTRNSNLLSAVLCLIKELDYPSLEVVGIAVRCRMDEFED